MNTLITFLAGCLLGTCPASAEEPPQLQLSLAETKQQVQTGTPDVPQPEAQQRTLTGSYLASQFAQRRQDWKTANTYLSDVIIHSPEDMELAKRAMILAAGSGDMDRALRFARQITAQDAKSPLALFFLACEALKARQYEKTLDIVASMPAGSLPEFVLPLLVSWAKAGTGLQETDSLNKNSVHIYHAIMIADFLKDYSHIEKLLKKAETRSKESEGEMEEIARIYAHIGQRDKALSIYADLLSRDPENMALAAQISSLKDNKNAQLFPIITSAEQGAAAAMTDMAKLLFQEDSPDSARVFAQLALYLQPGLAEANFLLAALAERTENYSEAIAFYRDIPESDPQYLEARRSSAELLAKISTAGSAIAELQAIATSKKDPQSMIRIGDIYREQKDFTKAIQHYNQAIAMFGEELPDEYWYIYYVRGMAYEQAGNWPKAEADLKAALEYQPDHPYVLNYLGYAWADKGINLTQALELIRRAVTLKPDDGYITDSLGWAYVRMGQYENAVPYLERAVELLPYDPVINDHLGDVYWKLGREREARFQWERARNFAEDSVLITSLDHKLEHGLQSTDDLVKEAHSLQPEPNTGTE